MLKEKMCFTAYNCEQEQKLAQETTYLTETYTVSSIINVIFYFEYFLKASRWSYH